MTDSWSEAPIPTPPTDPQAMARRAAQGATPDSAGYDPGRAVPGAPMQGTQSAGSAAQQAGYTGPRMPTSSKAAPGKPAGKGAAAKGKAAQSGATPFVWDGGLISEQQTGGPPPLPAPVAAPVPRPPAGPPEFRRSSLRRTQWAAVPPDETAGPGGGGGQIGPPNGPEGGSGRGRQVGLVVLGALVLVGLLIWVIASVLPNNKPAGSAVADATADATPSRSLQPLGASPFSAASDTAKPTPSAPKTTHSAAAPHTTQAQPATVKTSATHATTAAAPTPPTVNVQIADSENGLVIDVDNSGTAAGTLVGTWAADNTTAQHWHLVLQPNGSYVIYTELMDLKEGLEINTNANDYSGDAVTTLQAYDNDAQMQWTAKYLGSSDKYELVNNYNGQCLMGGGQGVANATTTCDTSDAHQAWTITG